MCLNGKCVLEHENSVDYDGNRFLRKLGEVDDDEEDFESRDSPAEPSNTRSTITVLTTKTKQDVFNKITFSSNLIIIDYLPAQLS
jgi:hypothetical protein